MSAKADFCRLVGFVLWFVATTILVFNDNFKF